MKFFWLVTLLLVTLPLHAQSSHRDGNWWLEQPRTVKTSYLIGFFDGTGLGTQFSYWNVIKDSDCFTKTTESFDFFSHKFLKGVTNEQLADGLDAFYKDYRNRKILIHSGVWLTLNAIAGTPQSDLDKMVENFRKSASAD